MANLSDFDKDGKTEDCLKRSSEVECGDAKQFYSDGERILGPEEGRPRWFPIVVSRCWLTKLSSSGLCCEI